MSAVDKAPWTQRLAWWLVGLLGAWLFRILYRSVRLAITGHTPPAGAVLGLYHQQFALITPWTRASGLMKTPFSVLVSDHRDGEYLARIIENLGGSTVRGDSRRRPVAGLRAILQVGKEGHTMVFAMDGPVGPRGVIKTGVVAAAVMLKKPVSLVFASAHKPLVFSKAWDRFFIPLPFRRAYLHIAEPWFPRAEMSVEENLAALSAYAAVEQGRLPLPPP